MVFKDFERNITCVSVAHLYCCLNSLELPCDRRKNILRRYFRLFYVIYVNVNPTVDKTLGK